MLICDECRTEMKDPKFVILKRSPLHLEQELNLPPEARQLSQIFIPLRELMPKEQQIRTEDIGVFDKLECAAKWAEKHKGEFDNQ